MVWLRDSIEGIEVKKNQKNWQEASVLEIIECSCFGCNSFWGCLPCASPRGGSARLFCSEIWSSAELNKYKKTAFSVQIPIFDAN